MTNDTQLIWDVQHVMESLGDDRTEEPAGSGAPKDDTASSEQGPPYLSRSSTPPNACNDVLRTPVEFNEPALQRRFSWTKGDEVVHWRRSAEGSCEQQPEEHCGLERDKD